MHLPPEEEPIVGLGARVGQQRLEFGCGCEKYVKAVLRQYDKDKGAVK